MSMKETCLNAFHNLPCKYILINTTCNTCIFHMVVNSSSESFVPRNSTSTLMRSQYCDWWRLPSGTKGTNLKFFKNPSNWHDLCRKGLRVECSYRRNSELYSYISSGCDGTCSLLQDCLHLYPPPLSRASFTPWISGLINFYTPEQRKTPGEKLYLSKNSITPAKVLTHTNWSGLFPYLVALFTTLYHNNNNYEMAFNKNLLSNAIESTLFCNSHSVIASWDMFTLVFLVFSESSINLQTWHKYYHWVCQHTFRLDELQFYHNYNTGVHLL